MKGVNMKLQEQKCVPCHGGMPPLSREDAIVMHEEIPEWTLRDNAVERTFTFKDFREAMKFVNKVAETAEQEGHHPDIHIYYSKVRIELTTHKIKGLSENDFILAAKINNISAADAQ
jgi:4a-hydroxytetrahydrobiopterin dehydratase